MSFVSVCCREVLVVSTDTFLFEKITYNTSGCICTNLTELNSPLTSPHPRNRSDGPYQPLLPRSEGSNCQVIAALVEGVDVDSPVGVGLFEPVLQHVLKVNTLPVTDPGVELYLQRADADVAAALLGDGLQSEDLQVDCGGLLQRSQIHPQLGLQHLGEHQFGAELEEAAARLPIHLHQGFRCGKENRYI